MPRCYDLCEDASIVGTPFYLMDFVAGRIFKDVTLKDMDGEAGVVSANSESRKAATYEAMSRVLAAIHRLDVSAEKLRDFGKADGGFLRRNLARWAGQVRLLVNVYRMIGSTWFSAVVNIGERLHLSYYALR